MKTFVDASAVAALCGFADRAAFLRARPRLEEEESFPLPMPTLRRPMLWRADQVTAWVERVGLPKAEAGTEEAGLFPPHLGANVVLLREARRV